mmetsp:Transcript_8845/g.26507  ORF Transcript_8845/g.26507 Transcript_8845/m.26507 type:complete len:108 (-) Transcript_8845:2113-2436(-)
MQSLKLTRPMVQPLSAGRRCRVPQKRFIITAGEGKKGEGGRQADKAKYFEKQQELDKKNPEPARTPGGPRDDKPPTNAYGSTNRDKGADIVDDEHMQKLAEGDASEK